MRSLPLRLMVAALVLSGCRSTGLTPTASTPVQLDAPTQGLFDMPWSDRSVFRAGLAESQQSVLGRLPGASVYHLALEIAPDLATVDGEQQVLYTNTESVALDRVALHLLPNLLGGELTLLAVRLDGKDVKPAYGEGEGSITIPLDPALAPGASIVIGIDFRVKVPQDLEVNYGVLANASGVLAYAHGYPMVAVYDADGWNLDVPPPYGDVTYADASFYLVRVRAPSDLVLCGSGSELSRSESGDQQEVLLAAGPARDFYLAASRGYRTASKAIGEVTLRSCSPEGTEARAERMLEIAARALEFFGEQYGDYPYTKLDVVTTPTYALGIEYPGAFALTDRLFTANQDFGDLSEEVLLESVTAHEAAHEWFYNLVGNDQIDDPWLDEALAQFATLQYYEDRYGEQGAAGMRDSFYGRWDRVGREPIPIGKPVGAYSEEAYSAIVYGRGPLFFEALEKGLGAKPFEELLRAYVAAFAWEEATPQDLQRMAEAQCGCDLIALFNEWVYAQP